MSQLPVPAALWAPKTRGLIMRFFAWQDRRKARAIGRNWMLAQDVAWRTEYTTWWMEHGWQRGADNPDVAYLKVRSTRR